MKASLLLRTAAALATLMACSGTPAQAQNYDGGGILKFGIFGQGTFIDFGVDQPAPSGAGASGLAVGMSLGFDILNRNGWLYGIEVDGAFGDVRGDALGIGYGLDYLVTVRGRAGQYVQPNLLVYGTAGLAFLGFEAQSRVFGDKAYETITGLTIGVGGEWDWHHHLFFAEYLYAGFGSRQFTLTDPVTGTDFRHEVDADVHMLRFGIKFKTGHDHYHGVPRDHRGHHDPVK